MNKTRAILFRVGAVVLLLAIAAVMMIVGRGHTVYFDNKKLEYEGQTFDSPYKVVVYVKGEQTAKLYDKERGMTTWIGQNFEVALEVTEEKGGDEVMTTYSIKLPYNMDGIVINIPAFLAGQPQEVYISEFIAAPPEEPDDEEPLVDEFGNPIIEEEPAV